MTEIQGVTVTSEAGITSFVPCIPGKTSDGYHTFDELYEHRCLLFIAFGKSLPLLHSWKSLRHEDGSQWEGWFIAGIDLPNGQTITYHLPQRLWDLCSFVDRDRAPEWDGHTSDDVLERIKSWIDS